MILSGLGRNGGSREAPVKGSYAPSLYGFPKENLTGDLTSWALRWPGLGAFRLNREEQQGSRALSRLAVVAVALSLPVGILGAAELDDWDLDVLKQMKILTAKYKAEKTAIVELGKTDPRSALAEAVENLGERNQAHSRYSGLPSGVMRPRRSDNQSLVAGAVAHLLGPRRGRRRTGSWRCGRGGSGSS